MECAQIFISAARPTVIFWFVGSVKMPTTFAQAKLILMFKFLLIGQVHFSFMEIYSPQSALMPTLTGPKLFFIPHLKNAGWPNIPVLLPVVSYWSSSDCLELP